MGIIRLLLAIAVFNSHFPLTEVPIVDGHEAVMTFFAISGFYMALILDRTYRLPGDFYLSRFVSLYPMYAFAMVTSLALLAWWDIHPLTSQDKIHDVLTNPLGFATVSLTSLFPLGQEMLFSMGQAADGSIHFVRYTGYSIWKHAPLVHAWSLSLEIVFYAMAPLLVRLKNRTLISLAFASILLRIAIMASPLSEVSFFWRFFPADFWYFGCGILSYRFYRTLPQKPSAGDWFAFTVLAGLIFISLSVDAPFKPFFLPMAAMVAMPFIFRGFEHLAFDRIIGKITYPFYLLHFSVIAVFEHYWEDPEGSSILVCALLTAVLAHYISNPVIEFWKQRVRAADLMPQFDGQAVQPNLSIAKP